MSGAAPARFLIITADDFGLNDAVNEAVRQAALSGVLTAASLMMGEPATPAAVRLAETLPGLRVGLHLVLVDGHSVLPAHRLPSLVDARGRFSNAMVLSSFRIAASRKVRAQLAAEIRAQFEAFARTGLHLDHVNAHKHFHLHPLILKMISRIGGEFGMAAVRIPREPFWYARLAGASAGAAFLLPWLKLMRARLRAAGITFNDQVFGLAATGRLDTLGLLDILARLPPGVTEIYLHPSLHNNELAALLDTRVRAAVIASGAVCGGYRDLRSESNTAVGTGTSK
ncbi:MAG: hopanoid biosynthesis-associated protein HpnK [Proteobacteria bacterium]|nr:hopanoid biosynthesis-associated protein HpnK [Pseudomonadota bacterium]